MLRTVCPELTLWEAILPEQALRLPPGLAEVDCLLDDPRFFEPFRPFFAARAGRPSIPMERYLRMMFLKYRYRLGFETLCAEVADSLAWRRFCRIPLDGTVPHPSTLEKITSRCGPEAVDGLNEALLAKAAEVKLIRLDRVRADTTVIPANVAYPSDAGLLGRGVARLTKLVGELKALGLAKRTQFRDRRRSTRRRAHALATWLRRRSEDAKAEALALTAEMTTIAAAALVDASGVARNARRKLNSAGASATGKAASVLAELERTALLLGRVIEQTKLRIAGGMPDGGTRVVSFHDPDARPIAKGRIGRPVEFGYKAQLVDNVDGVIVDYQVQKGNPPDARLLAPAVGRVIGRFRRAPTALTADRGYGDREVETALYAVGVKYVAIPRRGRPSAARRKIQQSRRFTKLVKWRTGCEGRIAGLKRNSGWSRTLMDGETGAQTWCAWGVLVHNSLKISVLTTQPDKKPQPHAQQRNTSASGNSPPTNPPPKSTAA